MKRKIIVLLSVLAVLIVLCAAYFYVEIYPYTLMGEVTYVNDADAECPDALLHLKMNPGSKFMSDQEEILLYIGEPSKYEYEIGDKLFVYCYDMIEDSLPPCLHPKWIYRYGRAE